MLDKMKWQYETAKAFMADERAEMNGGDGTAGGAVEVIVGLVVAGLMAAYLLPLVINELAAVSTTSWGDGASALWGILPVMIVLAIFIFFATLAVDQAGY